MTKIALLSDIHGNLTAFEAVVADSKLASVDEYWLLGDSFLIGHADQDLLEQLAALPITASIRGNWEDVILSVLKGEFRADQPADIYFARLVQYLMERSKEPVLTFIESTTMSIEKEVRGLKFLLAHQLPDKNYGRDLLMTSPQENFDQLFEQSQADIAIFGHIHKQGMRYSSQDQLIINPGSIGQPYNDWPALKKDLRAQYAILEISDKGLDRIDFRKVDYDVQMEIDRAGEKNLPYLDLYQELLEEGVLHTHDEELLAEIQGNNTHQDDVTAYFLQ